LPGILNEHASSLPELIKTVQTTEIVVKKVTKNIFIRALKPYLFYSKYEFMYLTSENI